MTPLATTATVIVAAAAATLSFVGLTNLAQETGFPSHLAWLLPVTVDGVTLVGSLILFRAVTAPPHSPLRSPIVRSYGWALIAAGISMSVWGNIAAVPNDPVTKIVHALPPIVFALTLEGLLILLRHPHQTAPPTPAKTHTPGSKTAAAPARPTSAARATPREHTRDPKTQPAPASAAIADPEERMQEALALVQDGTGIKAAAKQAGVGVGRLSARVKDLTPRNGRHPQTATAGVVE